MAATDPATPEPRRFLIRPPRPLWIGLALIVLICTGWQGYRSVAEEPLLGTHSNVTKLLFQGDFDQAYELTTEKYRENHDPERFRSDFLGCKGHPMFAPTAHVEVISFGFSSAEVYFGNDAGFFELLNGNSFFYTKENGEWRFTGRREHYLD
jgi:hypothetical protein